MVLYSRALDSYRQLSSFSQRLGVFFEIAKRVKSSLNVMLEDWRFKEQVVVPIVIAKS